MEKKAKRIVNIEIDDNVKRITIEGVDNKEQVVMRQELSDEELDNIAGGGFAVKPPQTCVQQSTNPSTTQLEYGPRY